MTYPDKLKNILTRFFVSLLKNPLALPHVANTNMKFKDMPIQKTANMLFKELNPLEKLLFSDDPSDIFKIKIFEGSFPLEVIAGTKSGLRYIQLIYVYSVGCIDQNMAEELIKKNQRHFEKKAKSADTDFLNSLPPALSKTVQSLASDVIADLEKKGKNPSNVSDILMNIDMLSLSNKIMNMPNTHLVMKELKDSNIDTSDIHDMDKMMKKLTKKK